MIWREGPNAGRLSGRLPGWSCGWTDALQSAQRNQESGEFVYSLALKILIVNSGNESDVSLKAEQDCVFTPDVKTNRLQTST